MGIHHEETLLGGRKMKSFDALRHTARGLEAIGFNPQASMYHVDRNYTPESDDERTLREKKQKRSFLKKIIGGDKEKGEKM
ncbi:hypothetical protein JMJ35_008576 [Cladonia borealis]|uniref:Uncharacterized protein n=1 Tax=Cladonia borealis TaxID=184061 RepID=A0AA39V703_9LECA|nr:hypothetical protein JMJ35_008576 [Cladonia borealis]